MAHILIGWELGGNRGHATKILAVARALQTSGHDVSFALQRVDALQADQIDGCPVWQAPLTPRLLVNAQRPRATITHSHGDSLARLGFDDSAIVAAIIRCWHRLFAAVKPDVVCAEFAPFLLLAARGSIPTVAIGTGFTLPPPAMPTFPSLTGFPAQPDEQALDCVNCALAETGGQPLATLPEVYSADRSVVGTFAELDPYRYHVKRELVSPCVPLSIPKTSGRGREIFLYAGPRLPSDAALWDGLEDSRLPVRAFIPDSPPDYRAALRKRGFAVEDDPVPFAQIVERSRLLLSTGSHGFVCAGMLAGIPQVLCPLDLEKALIAASVGQLGVGGVAPMKSIRREPFAASLRRIYESCQLAERAADLACDLRERVITPFHSSVVKAIARLV